ncbi:hypothetical protein FBU30_010259 [Linnemannia zychae]|nr:hypothetical protein FBU30_010259 [Linnemannia zychae]
MERTELCSSEIRLRRLHRRIGQSLGDRHKREDNISFLNRERAESPHQLEGIEGYMVSSSPPRDDRTIDQYHLRQHNDDCSHQQVRRDPVADINESHVRYLDSLPSEEYSIEDHLRSIRIQLGRRPIKKNGRTTRVENRSSILQTTRHKMGPARNRPLRLSRQDQTFRVHVMETRPQSNRSRCSTIDMEPTGMELYLPSLGVNPSNTTEDSAGESPSNCDHTAMAQYDMVPNNFSSNSIHRLDVFPRTGFLQSRKCGYQEIVVRISTDGRFQELMRLAMQRGVKRLRSNLIDINPVIRHLKALGPNRSINITNLTKKLCWLLATCGFLHPDDLRCTNAKASCIVKENLELEVLFPKEMRQGQKIIKPVVIQPHPDEALCPVRAFIEYRNRTQAGDQEILHPKDPKKLYIPLIRYVKDKSAATGTDRISNHIQDIMQLVPRIKEEPPFKARAIDATQALMKGVPVDDVAVHGNWSSPMIVDSFYRLSRSLASNFTQTVLS